MYIHIPAYYQKHKITDISNSNFTYHRCILIFSLSIFVNSFSNGEKPGPQLSQHVCWIHPQCNWSLIPIAPWVDILLTSFCLQHPCLAAAPPWYGCCPSLAWAHMPHSATTTHSMQMPFSSFLGTISLHWVTSTHSPIWIFTFLQFHLLALGSNYLNKKEGRKAIRKKLSSYTCMCMYTYIYMLCIPKLPSL